MSRDRFSTQVDPYVANRVRAAIIGLGKQGVMVTLAEATEAALDAWVRQAENDFNDGQPFDPAGVELRRGVRVRPPTIPPNNHRIGPSTTPPQEP